MFKHKNTEISLIDAISMVDNFCPIKIYYNNELVWDDDMAIGFGWVSLETALWSFKNKHPEWVNIVIHTIKIDIVDFHHSIIRLKGKKRKIIDD